MSIFDEDKPITIESLEEFGFNHAHMNRWDYKVFGGERKLEYIMTISWDERIPNKLSAHIIRKVYEKYSTISDDEKTKGKLLVTKQQDGTITVVHSTRG